MNKLILFGLSVFGVVSLTTASVSAHVIITSEQGGGKAVFHISPADDPVAGKESTLFFDIESTNTPLDNATATLTITSKSGEKEAVPAGVNQGTVSANYTFPAADTFKLELVVSNPDLSAEVLKFTHNQIVRAGAASTEAKQTGNTSWPLIIGGVLLVATAGLALVKRKDIMDSMRASAPKK